MIIDETTFLAKDGHSVMSFFLGISHQVVMRHTQQDCWLDLGAGWGHFYSVHLRGRLLVFYDVMYRFIRVRMFGLLNGIDGKVEGGMWWGSILTIILRK
jgi:hypothetical protein